MTAAGARVSAAHGLNTCCGALDRNVLHKAIDQTVQAWLKSRSRTVHALQLDVLRCALVVLAPLLDSPILAVTTELNQDQVVFRDIHCLQQRDWSSGKRRLRCFHRHGLNGFTPRVLLNDNDTSEDAAGAVLALTGGCSSSLSCSPASTSLRMRRRPEMSTKPCCCPAALN